MNNTFLQSRINTQYFLDLFQLAYTYLRIKQINILVFPREKMIMSKLEKEYHQGKHIKH